MICISVHKDAPEKKNKPKRIIIPEQGSDPSPVVNVTEQRVEGKKGGTF